MIHGAAYFVLFFLFVFFNKFEIQLCSPHTAAFILSLYQLKSVLIFSQIHINHIVMRCRNKIRIVQLSFEDKMLGFDCLYPAGFL